jgi:carbon starvation protein
VRASACGSSARFSEGVFAINALALLVIGLCAIALAYRYYASFLAAKVAILDDSRPTPAHTQGDGRDYHATNRWILFGHHFAAIAGAGPLIGPVLAAQYGYLPGAIWILIGSIFAGGVHDFIILFASVRQRGESLSKIAQRWQGPVSGTCTAIAILFIIIVAIASLAIVVVNALKGSPWGTFTIVASIPIALLMGQWLYRFRPGRVAEASAIGVVLLLGAVLLGHPVQHSVFAHWFNYSDTSLRLMLPVYGFFAAALPVWMLLVPRDYLSTYMKLGTVVLLAIGIFIVHPQLRMPATTPWIHGGGPVVPGPVWPYVCITIACGAISGFHSLVASGTTPKMLNRESDIPLISYGSMVIEGGVALMALIAACALYQSDYFAISTSVKNPLSAGFVAHSVQLNSLTQAVGEQTLVGRAGGSVVLAVGMASIFSGIPLFKNMVAYWYHFAIMFEALFILTTIDAGTRVARFVVQEMLGAVVPRLRDNRWLPGVWFTSALVTFAWGYLVYGGTIDSIWPMFGVANQLLGVLALAIGTTFILKHRPARYALVTFLPFCFLVVTVVTAGVMNIRNKYWPEQDWLKAGLTSVMLVLVVITVLDSARRWVQILTGREGRVVEAPPQAAPVEA